MPLNNIPVEKISEADLTALITNGEGEGIDLEYKQQAYGLKDADKRELLADVSSFANSEGGHLVIGMKETKGIASALPGLDSSSIDDEKQRIEQILNSGLQPRLYRFELRDVPLASGKKVLVLRIPRSINPPHRVSAYGSNRFWCRNSAGKYEPNVDQLRRLFQRLPDLAQRIRGFRSERLPLIDAGIASIRLQGLGKLVLHIMPIEAFDLGPSIDVKNFKDYYQEFPPLRHTGALDFRYNLDGFLVHTAVSGSGCKSYLQVFKNGPFEGARGDVVQTRSGDPRRVAYSAQLERDLIYGSTAYLNALTKLNFRPPFALMASLIGVETVQLDFSDPPQLFDRNSLLFQELMLEEVPASDKDIPRILRPVFDEMFQASGQSGCPRFDRNGNYVPPP